MIQQFFNFLCIYRLSEAKSPFDSITKIFRAAVVALVVLPNRTMPKTFVIIKSKNIWICQDKMNAVSVVCLLLQASATFSLNSQGPHTLDSCLLLPTAAANFSTHDLNGNKSCVKIRLGFGLCNVAASGWLCRGGVCVCVSWEGGRVGATGDGSQFVGISLGRCCLT